MKAGETATPDNVDLEVSALIETLRQTEQRLRDLTGGEVDAVTDAQGRTFLLQHAQDSQRYRESVRRAAILDALPANIALLDTKGIIVSTNQSWRRFAETNVLQAPGPGVGLSYLWICDAARGDDAADAHEAAAGIRAVLAGELRAFSLEYPCHTPTQQRWFLMKVTPLDDDYLNGAVVLHLDITERKLGEARLHRLNRLHSVLSKVGETIVKKHDQQSLYEAVCRVVVEDGRMRMVFIVEVDAASRLARPVASYGAGQDCLLEPASLIPTAGGPLSLATVGTVLRTGAHDFCNDIAGAERMKPWHATARKHGLLANASFPLRQHGAIVGVLVLYAGETGYFQDDEIALMVEVSQEISLALEALEKEHLRQLADSALRQSEASMSAAQRIAHFGSWEWGLSTTREVDGNPVFWSDEMFRIAGYEPGGVEVSNDIFFHHVPVEEHASIRQAVAEAIRTRSRYSVVHRLIRPSGEQRILHEIGQIYFDEVTGQPLKVVGTAHDITEQRKSEDALRESEQRYRALVDWSPEAISVQRGGKLIFVNQACVKAMGAASAEDLLGRTALDLLHPDYHAVVKQRLMDTAAGGAPPMIEEKLIRLDGAIIDVEVQAIAIQYYGEPAILGSIRDVTERKRSELALQRQQSELRALFDLLPAMVCFKDTNNVLLRANRRLADATGKSIEEMEGKPTHEVYPDEAAKYYADDLEVIQSGVPKLGIIETLPGAQGEAVWVQTDKVPYFDKDGKVIGLVVMVQDITERKRSEETLRASEERFRNMFTSAATGIAISTPDGRFLEANAAYCRMLGYTVEELRERDFASLTHADDITLNLKLRDELLTRQREGFVLEKRYLHKRGDIVWTRHSVSALRAANGDVLSLMVLAEDITERKKAEVALQTLAWEKEQQERILHTTLASITDFAYIFDRQGRFLFANQPLLDLLGIDLDAAVGRDFFDLGYPGGLAAKLQSQIQDVFETRRRVTDETPFTNPAGLEGHYEYIFSPVVAADGTVEFVVGSTRDITQRKEAVLEISRINQGLRDSEIRIKYLNRVHAMLSGINALIVRVRDRDELFGEACRIAVEEGGFHVSMVGMLDRGAMKVVPVAMAGNDEELLAAIKDVLASDTDAPNTMAAMAIRERKPFVANDAQTDSRILLGRNYNKTGVRSVAVFPLLVSDKAVGIFTLYADEIEFFQHEEMELLKELSSDIAFAIDHLDKADKLSYLAYYDELTGLPNRNLFLDRVAQHMRSAIASGQQVALLLFDIERFKSINDSLGRPAGDALLKQMGEWLIRETGDANHLARLGADHFAVVIPDAKPDGDVARFVEKTMAAMVNHPFRLQDALFRITIKAGVALFPGDGENVDVLFQHAEAALKKAKATGNRYLFFSKNMSEKVASKLTLENKLRLAIENEEFVLHYQPKVHLASGTLTSAEALIRWNDPASGLVAPYLFIPILEETGLIHDVGRWALRKAIAEYLCWRDAGLAAVRIAVNVSPLQLRDRSFVDEIKQVIGVDATASAGLELEITESMIMEDVKHGIASLSAIREMGVPVAIDDFGTGFSSLSYLSKLPIDTLKVDRSFIIDMTASADGLALVSTIINLAHSLRLKVVGEGVETDEQKRLLQLLRCDEMQGYLFSKPVPGDVFEAKFLAPSAAA